MTREESLYLVRSHVDWNAVTTSVTSNRDDLFRDVVVAGPVLTSYVLEASTGRGP